MFSSPEKLKKTHTLKKLSETFETATTVVLPRADATSHSTLLSYATKILESYIYHQVRHLSLELFFFFFFIIVAIV